MSFAHLHVHTEFSMLDGAARVQELVRAVAADNQPAVAITPARRGGPRDLTSPL